MFPRQTKRIDMGSVAMFTVCVLVNGELGKLGDFEIQAEEAKGTRGCNDKFC